MDVNNSVGMVRIDYLTSIIFVQENGPKTKTGHI